MYRKKSGSKPWGIKLVITLSLCCWIIFIGWFVRCLPRQLFTNDTATVLLDEKGGLLGARIANDGQWRFAAADSVPLKFEKCLLQFEDRDYYTHHGISVKAVGRAVKQNFSKQKIVSGGSTITMQLARMLRHNPRRSYHEKIIEGLMALRLEMAYTKKDILKYYACNAPFGNNVVGLEAASWRYYGRSSEKLSWAESATLAVLPNAPGLIYPGKNHQRLLEKRNRLLRRLFNTGLIDAATFELALQEPLPERPLPLPQLAPHLLARLMKQGLAGQTIVSSIDMGLQVKTNETLQQYCQQLAENKIYNAAVLITSVRTGKVLVYIGNSSNGEDHSNSVDCAEAPRSTGSILKPFLYARCLHEGLMTPATLLPDVPTHFGSFSPNNFSREFNGAVPANQALARSLNIPFVRLLNEYGAEKFRDDLRQMGIRSVNKPASHYGLSLILGGAEARLWELNRAYTEMAQTLQNKPTSVSVLKVSREKGQLKNKAFTDRACIYATFEAMCEVNRPDEEGNWRAFASAQKIAWKTGTSFGYRDGWAIGITPDYVVSVWVGNADGVGRPGLTGIRAAAPLLFRIFNQLPASGIWFHEPFNQMKQVKICSLSGYRAGALCEQTSRINVPAGCLNTAACPYHQLVHLAKDGLKRVDSDCEQPSSMQHVSWFVLPPVMEKYYKLNHPGYKSLPEFKAECLAKVADKAMAVLYPKPGCKIYVPFEIDGSAGKTIFEATHRNADMKIYWHLDDEYIGETKDIHQVAMRPAAGKHKLLLTDENGISCKIEFSVISKN